MGKPTWAGIILLIIVIVLAAFLCIKYIPGAQEWFVGLFDNEQTEQEEQQEETEDTDSTVPETTLILTTTKGDILYEFSS